VAILFVSWRAIIIDLARSCFKYSWRLLKEATFHIPYPGSRIGYHLPNELFFQKNLVRQMLIWNNILQYSFIFSVKSIFGKNKFPKILALLFWNYFKPNLLPGYGSYLFFIICSRVIIWFYKWKIGRNGGYLYIFIGIWHQRTWVIRVLGMNGNSICIVCLSNLSGCL
jgi:hypothetical protein